MIETNPTINIISNCAKSKIIRGPQKVFKNTCKGLELIGQPFVVNKNLNDYSWNWVHDSIEGLVEVSSLGIPAVLGPNIAVLPEDLPKFRSRFKNCIYLQPSIWVVNLWVQLGFTECKLLTWPSGIDIESFDINRKNVSANLVMIYYKERSPELLTEIIQIVRKQKLTPIVIKYGEYTDKQYLDALSKCSFGIWVGRQESQGIALQEALASGITLIVIDATSLFDTFAQSTYMFSPSLKSFITTSAPYFDQRCGRIINSIDKLDLTINEIKDGIDGFNSKEYVKENLSLEISARKLVDIFSQLKLESSPIQKREKLEGKDFSVSFMTEVVLSLQVPGLKIKNILLQLLKIVRRHL